MINPARKIDIVNAVMSSEEILINDDLTFTLGEHTISKEDRKVISDILKTYYKSAKSQK